MGDAFCCRCGIVARMVHARARVGGEHVGARLGYRRVQFLDVWIAGGTVVHHAKAQAIHRLPLAAGLEGDLIVLVGPSGGIVGIGRIADAAFQPEFADEGLI